MAGLKVPFVILHLLIISAIIPTLISPVAAANIVESLPGYPGVLPFQLETGYVGVGESEQIQLFYYFIESERNPNHDPLILWLTGGPGPLKLNSTASVLGSDAMPSLEINPYSWTKVASIIFVDSPVGTGYSYATSSNAYHSNDSIQSNHLTEFLYKWLMDHPKFLDRPLYVSGDSYAGKIVPVIVQNIINDNDKGLRPMINLKGFILGNPVTDDSVEDVSTITFEHRVSLLSDELFESAKESCNGDPNKADANNTLCSNALDAISKAVEDINTGHVLEPKCSNGPPWPDRIRSSRTLSSSRPWCRDDEYPPATNWANNETVLDALRVRKGTFGKWIRCNATLPYVKSIPSTVGYHRNWTTKPLRGLVYSGDQDTVMPYVGTLAWIKKLNLSLTYNGDNWRPWFVGSQVAGYVTSYSKFPYSLTFTTIKGGGHTAPEYRPRECFAMIVRWLALRFL